GHGDWKMLRRSPPESNTNARLGKRTHRGKRSRSKSKKDQKRTERANRPENLLHGQGSQVRDDHRRSLETQRNRSLVPRQDSKHNTHGTPSHKRRPERRDYQRR